MRTGIKPAAWMMAGAAISDTSPVMTNRRDVSIILYLYVWWLGSVQRSVFPVAISNTAGFEVQVEAVSHTGRSLPENRNAASPGRLI